MAILETIFLRITNGDNPKSQWPLVEILRQERNESKWKSERFPTQRKLRRLRDSINIYNQLLIL